MGRLIPAGTGMKYYRNVKVDYDPTVDQKETDEYDELAELRGGFEFPGADIPLVKTEPEVEFEEVEEDEEELDLDDENLEIEDDSFETVDGADDDEL